MENNSTSPQESHVTLLSLLKFLTLNCCIYKMGLMIPIPKDHRAIKMELI